jgi:hypothetical protein
VEERRASHLSVLCICSKNKHEFIGSADRVSHCIGRFLS